MAAEDASLRLAYEEWSDDGTLGDPGTPVGLREGELPVEVLYAAPAPPEAEP